MCHQRCILAENEQRREKHTGKREKISPPGGRFEAQKETEKTVLLLGITGLIRNIAS